MSISVVIPAYNSEVYLRATLESVFAQTLLPDEVLVVDDGSTDATVAIAESFGPRVRVLRQQHQRASAARNLGVRESTGEWIALLDADDLWLPNKLEKQMEQLRQVPGADLCYTARRVLYEKDGTFLIGRAIKVPPPSRIREALYRNTTFIPSTVVIRRSTFLAAGGFRPEQRWAQDWEFWMRLLHAGAVFAGCEEPLILYRSHGSSMSANAMGSMNAAKEVYLKYAYPTLPRLFRWMHRNQVFAVYEGEAAYMLRRMGDRRCLPMMASSIVHSPFWDVNRYKALAHMCMARLRGKPV